MINYITFIALVLANPSDSFWMPTDTVYATYGTIEGSATEMIVLGKWEHCWEVTDTVWVDWDCNTTDTIDGIIMTTTAGCLPRPEISTECLKWDEFIEWKPTPRIDGWFSE